MENPFGLDSSSINNIKNYCVSCGKPIPINQLRYTMYGNYCQKCSSKCSLIVKARVFMDSIKIGGRQGEISKVRLEPVLEELKQYKIYKKDIDLSRQFHEDFIKYYKR